MGSFYFFLSSLPFIQFARQPGVTLASVLEQAQYHTSASEYNELLRMTGDTFDGIPFQCSSAKQYMAFETTLRNRLAVFRANRMKADAENYLHDTEIETSAEQAAKTAFDEPNPLKAEELLLGARFDFLSNLESGHFFDFDALAIYVLKLKVAERFISFDAEPGKALYRKVQNDTYEKEDV